MEFTWKKILLIGGSFLILIIGPLFLLSNPMMEYYQKRCDREPEKNKWLQIKSADWCFSTMRPELAKPRYLKYYERYKEDPKREYAFYRWAMSVEETESSKAGVQAFEQFLEVYPNGQFTKEANDGIIRIRYSKTQR